MVKILDGWKGGRSWVHLDVGWVRLDVGRVQSKSPKTISNNFIREKPKLPRRQDTTDQLADTQTIQQWNHLQF